MYIDMRYVAVILVAITLHNHKMLLIVAFDVVYCKIAKSQLNPLLSVRSVMLNDRMQTSTNVISNQINRFAMS